MQTCTNLKLPNCRVCRFVLTWILMIDSFLVQLFFGVDVHTCPHIERVWSLNKYWVNILFSDFHLSLNKECKCITVPSLCGQWCGMSRLYHLLIGNVTHECNKAEGFCGQKVWVRRLLGPLSKYVGVARTWVHGTCVVWRFEVGGFFVSFQQVHGVLVFMADVRTYLGLICGWLEHNNIPDILLLKEVRWLLSQMWI